MDSLCTAAARALAAGDPLGALKLVALRDDAPALALRGVAMAQLGELARAKKLLERASRAFGRREVMARARCAVAHAEVAWASRDLSTREERSLSAAIRTLESHGDRANALHARLLLIRRWLLLGRMARAQAAIQSLELDGAPPRLVAIGELVGADIALRHWRTREARAGLERARAAAENARIPALAAEIEHALAAFQAPAARLIESGNEKPLRLAEVEAVLASKSLVVDGFRRVVRGDKRAVGLARRPVLFALARDLAEAWPQGVPRERLIAHAFGARRANDSHRARLRVEIGRLRRELHALAAIRATAEGFVLCTRRERAACVLAPPIDSDRAALLALLGDGESWSTSALALALGRSQRSVQRALSELYAASKVRALGHARARRWLAPPITGFTTALLLPAPLPLG